MSDGLKRTQWLIEWSSRMSEKNGPPRNGIEWCRKLAYHMGEAGNDNPSIEAIETAKRWEANNPEKLDSDN